MTTAERLTAVAENVQKVYEAGKAAGGLPDGDMTDPDYVYAVTRPKDWLPMPRPGDNEAYLLGYLLEGAANQFSAIIEFSGSCSVEFGTVQAGVFVAKESIPVSSNVRFTKILDFDSYGDETADGYRQYMVRVSGSNITSITPRKESGKPTNNIVDIVSGLTAAIVPGTTVGNDLQLTLKQLRYCRFVGNGTTRYLPVSFANCEALISVSAEKEPSSGYSGVNYAFLNCKRLVAVSPNLLGVPSGTDVTYAFSTTSLSSVKVHGQPTSCFNTFMSSNLSKFESDTLDTSKATSVQNMLRDCPALRTCVGLDITSATNITGLFDLCYLLQKLTFAGETTPGGVTLNLTATALSHPALVEMIASLPTAIAAATITITGVPGASELTDAEIAVATAKNWTITR